MSKTKSSDKSPSPPPAKQARPKKAKTKTRPGPRTGTKKAKPAKSQPDKSPEVRVTIPRSDDQIVTDVTISATSRAETAPEANCQSDQPVMDSTDKPITASPAPPSGNPKKFGFSLDDQGWMDQVEIPSIDVPLDDGDRRTVAVATLRDFCLHVGLMNNRENGYCAWLVGGALQKLRPLPKTGPVDKTSWIPNKVWCEFLRAIDIGQDTSELRRHIWLMYDAGQAKAIGLAAMVKGYRATRRKGGTGEGDEQPPEPSEHDWGPGDIGMIRKAIGACFKQVNPLCTSVSPDNISAADAKYVEFAEKEIDTVKRKCGDLQRQLRQSPPDDPPPDGDDVLTIQEIKSKVNSIRKAAEFLGEADFLSLPDAESDETQAVLKKCQESLAISVAWIEQGQGKMADLQESSKEATHV